MNLHNLCRAAIVGATLLAGATAVAIISNPDAALSTPVATSRADAGQDITAQYIVNPSFEADGITGLNTKNESDGFRGWLVTAPQGWTVNTGVANPVLFIDKDCYTDNGFGQVATIPDGTYAFYLRVGWTDGSSSVTQNVTLPAGKYRLSVDWRARYANSATSSFTLRGGDSRKSESFEAGSAGIFATAPWKTSSVEFSLAEEGTATVGIDISWLSGGSCIMIDNVKLYKLSDTPDEPVEEPTEADIASPTEGVITSDFVAEAAMKDDILQMLANFATWMKADFQECAAPNSKGEECGCFKGENTMGNNEQGVRPNADLSMICAFLVKYGKDKVTLPAGITWDDLSTLARKSLVFSYSTHKANKLKVCKDNNYWGSTSNSDHVWESSLWAMSVAYSAFFQWDSLSDEQKGYIKALLVAECQYEIERSIPTGYSGDTKAEENGWEADILAATLGMFPDHEKASKWFDRLREFAINSYSHIDDASDNTIIDPEYDNKTVANLYKGKNLYDDYTLQNHNLFHTSYQNVVMQELGEAALALKIFQSGIHGKETWKTNALMHNNQKVMDEVLNWLALADGELAMPNGNDWSLFLYDQITSYSTMACFLRDPNALMLENLAYKYIKARQQTTTDGAWLLNADVGARRMGVEAHRVMMTWLMHQYMSTDNLTPTRWDDFNTAYSDAKVFGSQNIVRAATDDRFTCFSWSSGLKSYTGYFAPNSPDNNKIIVPYRANNTGNILGWYTVSGKGTNATPVVSGIYRLKGNAYTMNGEINTNDAALNNRFALYSTPGNALIYIDYVRANSDATITGERGGLMAISTDPFMKETRTFYYGNGAHSQADGKAFTEFSGNYVNIDNALGFVSVSDKKMGFGDRSLNNSIYTAKLYPSYSTESRTVKSGNIVDKRNIIYYSRVDAATTKALAEGTIALADALPEGWNGVLAPEPNGAYNLLVANFLSSTPGTLSGITLPAGAPVFEELTTIGTDGKASATFIAEINNAIGEEINVFVAGAAIKARQDSDNSTAAYLLNEGTAAANITVTIIDGDKTIKGTVEVAADKCVYVSAENGTLSTKISAMPLDDDPANLTDGYTDITDSNIANANFENDKTYGTIGAASNSSGSYDPCYTNTVAAANKDYPNVLPVEGWTAGTKLSGASNFCRMYSMPYSTTMYVVSPSDIGNYSAQCAPALSDPTAGDRCLTVLNSWSTGSNQIYQDVALPSGEYRMLLNAKYECPNQTSNTGAAVTAGDNTNTSLTGIAIGNNTDYRYPTTANAWQTLVWDFKLTEPTTVRFSMGYKNSANTGAANQTTMYLDNLRLYGKEMGRTDISDITAGTVGTTNVYSIDGHLISTEGATDGLAAGFYIIGNRKIFVK